MIESVIVSILYLAIGIIARKLNILTVNDSKVIAKIILYISMPIVIFISLITNDIKYSKLYSLTISGFTIPLFLLSIAYLSDKYILKLSNDRKGVYIAGVTVANLGYFLYPLFQILYGKQGMVYLIAYDVGNIIFAFSVTFYVAMKYSTKKTTVSIKSRLKKIITFPPIIAVICAIILTYNEGLKLLILDMPLLLEALNNIGVINIVLAMLLLGINIRFRIEKPKVIFFSIVIRMVIGSFIGFLVASFLGFDDLKKTTMILASGVPIGLTILFYSIELDLDQKLAASIIGISLIIGFVLVSILGGFIN